jgi:serine/threonine protein phosphatase PrpC
VIADIGTRKTMEDRHFVKCVGPDIYWYAVLDGHGGDGAVEYFQKRLPKALKKELKKQKFQNYRKAVRSVFRTVDKKWYRWRPWNQSGTTITSALITPTRIYVINLGDSRTLVMTHECSKYYRSLS